jgi:hypothetical protein
MMRPLLFKGCIPFVTLALILTSCASLPPAREEWRTVVVWYIEGHTLSTAVRADMGEILMIEIIETLKKRGTYEVIERERLDLTLEEQRIGTKNFVDETTRLKIGRMLGARYMVFTDYLAIVNNMSIILRLVEVETGANKKNIRKTPSGPDLAAWMEAARKAAEEL